jgi:hypothetical protein
MSCWEFEGDALGDSENADVGPVEFDAIGDCVDRPVVAANRVACSVNHCVVAFN